MRRVQDLPDSARAVNKHTSQLHPQQQRPHRRHHVQHDRHLPRMPRATGTRERLRFLQGLRLQQVSKYVLLRVQQALRAHRCVLRYLA